jgi:hypothetical protein
MTAKTGAGERRQYWISAALLAVAAPLAVLPLRAEWLDWFAARTRQPVLVERGATHDLAGATWRLAGLTPLPGELPETKVMLAELEIDVTDADRLRKAAPCFMTLTDAEGRRWSSNFLMPYAARSLRPDLADAKSCLNLIEAQQGTVQLMGNFIIPDGTKGLAIILSMNGEPQRRLLLK